MLPSAGPSVTDGLDVVLRTQRAGTGTDVMSRGGSAQSEGVSDDRSEVRLLADSHVVVAPQPRGNREEKRGRGRVKMNFG